MDNILNPVSPQRCQEVFRQLTAAEHSGDLLTCLINLQAQHGIDPVSAEANARRCMEFVAAHEALTEEISENAGAVMEKCFARLAKQKPGARLDALHQILFGLSLPSRQESALPLEECYAQYRNDADPGLTAEELELQILQQLQQYHPTPHMLYKMSYLMRTGTGYLASAEALAEEGRNLKCLLAMDLWLHNADTLTMADAALQASTHVEAQAVADAVQRGYIVRDTAIIILTILGLAIAMYGTFQLLSFLPEALLSVSEVRSLYGGTLAAAQAKQALIRKSALGGFLLHAFGLGLECFSEELSNLIGSVSVHFSCMLRKAGEDAATLEPLADALAAEGAETAYAYEFAHETPSFLCEEEDPVFA